MLLFRGHHLVGYQRMQVLIEDFVLAVGQFLEAGEGGIKCLVAFQLNAKFLQTGLEGVAP